MGSCSPYDAYSQLLSGMTGASLPPPSAAAALEKHFTRSSGDATVTILLLDEMDYLVTKKQTVLYNLFDWPTRSSVNRLCIVGVANTINLPER